MLLRSPGPISPDTYSGHIRRRALCPNRLRNGMSQRSSSSCQSDILPTMVGPSKSRPPMSHRKTDLGIPCRSKSAKVVLGFIAVLAGWTTTEVGRQPWTVYGLLRTADSTSPSLVGGDVLVSLLAYVVVYLIIYPSAVLIAARLVRKGPALAPGTVAPIESGRPSAPINIELVQEGKTL